jgi:hypothetical protein
VQKLSGTVCGLLGWTAGQFWRSTPDELAAIFTAFSAEFTDSPGARPLGSARLEKLKELYPDG